MTTRTTGQMRETLAKIAEDVVAGKITTDRANSAVKAYAQINESLYAECKISQLRKLANAKAEELGKMPIND